MISAIDEDRYPLASPELRATCRNELDTQGALVLEGFFTTASLAAVLAESESRLADAYYTESSHNVYLSEGRAGLAQDHPLNRQVHSSKGCLTDDQIDADSPLRQIYNSPDFRAFLCAVLEIDQIHPYADSLSSINVHFHQDGQELGWHFDNSSFAVTMLIQAPKSGGHFEYVTDIRPDDESATELAAVGAILDGLAPVRTLDFESGALVLFRGHNAMHRVTPSEGERTRILVVFAYNTEPGVALSPSAQQTFYGRRA